MLIPDVIDHAEIVNLDITSILVSLFVAIPATIGAIAALKGVRKADEAKHEAVQTKAEVLEAVDTTNDKSLGVAVHDMAQTLEFVVAQQHTNTTELLMVADQVRKSNDKLDRHLEEIGPLKTWVEEQIERGAVDG